MKNLVTDANFPRTEDGRVYHLGIRSGEVANRVVTVGSPSRAEAIAGMLDDEQPYKILSERGFLTITGRYKGIPVSIVSIGMGYPNMDFFVREARECISGDMVIIRLGSCGGVVGLPVGSLVVPNASVSVNRNVDYDFGVGSENKEPAYRISKPARLLFHSELHAALSETLTNSSPQHFEADVRSDTVNASADRLTSFPDCNENLIDELLAAVPNLASLEMETFHLFHLASVWRTRTSSPSSPSPALSPSMPPTTLPVTPTLSQNSSRHTPPLLTDANQAPRSGRIRAAAVQMIFASRTSQDFITPEHVAELEAWSGRSVLETLCNFPIPFELLHDEEQSVWSKS
ncbi:purine and uridine phosphorylase [Rickenella mellea]|uniref:Purine and uridine phosphorylase n=1 Tax=Rickenella mellea TaxID=50990 RepID=A0A4Y7Q5L5_9AGAM|nr:purine and uridine phosphorylase [Rickenella mellea]